jgi:hypothetical protein
VPAGAAEAPRGHSISVSNNYTYYVLLFTFVTAISVLPYLSSATLPPAQMFVNGS